MVMFMLDQIDKCFLFFGLRLYMLQILFFFDGGDVIYVENFLGKKGMIGAGKRILVDYLDSLTKGFNIEWYFSPDEKTQEIENEVCPGKNAKYSFGDFCLEDYAVEKSEDVENFLIREVVYRSRGHFGEGLVPVSHIILHIFVSLAFYGELQQKLGDGFLLSNSSFKQSQLL